MKNPFYLIIEDLAKANEQLQRAIHEPESDIVRDATIQRFEFTFELFWKTLKKILAYEGDPSTSPRETLKKAYQNKIIDDEVTFLQMLEDRNKTTHIYNQEMAQKIYTNIKDNAPKIDVAIKNLSNKYGAK
ncbi:nucleotidyltransferase substrate binding protein [Alphaproteobacteria bacterium]|nr:nucleotidyltransferase substrate binding protein [Alphaproteobacteria bacterium]